jgi:hypothetical protein
MSVWCHEPTWHTAEQSKEAARRRLLRKPMQDGYQPNSVSSLFFNDAPYFSEVLIELLAVPDACARPKVSRTAATKLP